jgi:hypothetical protein
MRAIPLFVALVTAVPSMSASQVVLADIHIGGGPVQGRVVIGHPGYYHSAPVIVSRYHPPSRRRPVAVRYGPYRLVTIVSVDLWFHPATGQPMTTPIVRPRARVSLWETAKALEDD